MFPNVAIGNGIIVFLFGITLLIRNGITWLENHKLIGKSIQTKGKVVDLVYDDGEMLACQFLVEFQAIDGKRIELSHQQVMLHGKNIWGNNYTLYITGLILLLQKLKWLQSFQTVYLYS
jgi:hypothetical protein